MQVLGVAEREGGSVQDANRANPREPEPPGDGVPLLLCDMDHTDGGQLGQPNTRNCDQIRGERWEMGDRGDPYCDIGVIDTQCRAEPTLKTWVWRNMLPSGL